MKLYFTFFIFLLLSTSSFQELHDMIGKSIIKKFFFVDIEFHSESFFIKSITFLCNFISQEYSEKNPGIDAAIFLKISGQKKKMAIFLKDHCFCHFQECYLSLLYHLDDLAEYLSENTNIINDVVILDRSFLEMELIKPICAAISLLCLHITKPFHALFIHKTTTYSMLLTSFRQLSKDLTQILPKIYLSTNKVVNFISNDMFEKAKSDL